MYIKKLTNNFSTIKIIKAFFSALCLSTFIFLSYFDITNPILHTLFAFIGFYLLLNSSKVGYFFTGFFVGIFWFYWISFSFRYYDLTFLIPIVILAIGIIYGLMFLFASFISKSPFIRAIALVLVLQINPFGFNWFNLELIFYYTPVGLSILHVLAFILSILIFQNFKGAIKYISILFLILSLDFSNNEAPKVLPFKTQIVQTQISQDIKWDREFIASTLEDNFSKIQKAIDEGNRLIIFPETAFPLYLNTNEYTLNKLNEYSKQIAIITGSLSYENNKYYNSAYFFDNEVMQRADKVVLVPFGESIPLPRFLTDFINRIVFDDSSDFSEANEPKDFIVDGVKIRSAICYEGSTKILFSNNPEFMSVLTNNAWFLPSSEPILQNLMLSFYATKSNTTILHAVNGEGGGIIYPRKSKIIPLFKKLIYSSKSLNLSTASSLSQG